MAKFAGFCFISDTRENRRILDGTTVGVSIRARLHSHHSGSTIFNCCYVPHNYNKCEVRTTLTLAIVLPLGVIAIRKSRD
jgi:hypothetical protein